MPPAEHIQAELDRQREKMDSLSEEIVNSRERIMNTINNLTQDQNRRIETMGATWNEQHTRVRIDVAVLKAKAAFMGFLAGMVAPLIVWALEHWAK